MHNTIRQPSPAVNIDIEDILSSMGEIEVTAAGGHIMIKAKGDTWSRSARRKRKRQDLEVDLDTVVLICTIKLEDGNREIVYQWVHGEDRGLFESFCSHVSRKVVAR